MVLNNIPKVSTSYYIFHSEGHIEVAGSLIRRIDRVVHGSDLVFGQKLTSKELGVRGCIVLVRWAWSSFLNDSCALFWCDPPIYRQQNAPWQTLNTQLVKFPKFSDYFCWFLWEFNVDSLIGWNVSLHSVDTTKSTFTKIRTKKQRSLSTVTKLLLKTPEASP